MLEDYIFSTYKRIHVVCVWTIWDDNKEDVM